MVALKDMTPEQATKAEWRIVHRTLAEAQERLEADGNCRHSWLDAPTAMAKERGA